jgi:2-polyprenyl-3-methyl-5-hydroxy-6-metoxy-1,4-benzoquinol methylase
MSRTWRLARARPGGLPLDGACRVCRGELELRVPGAVMLGDAEALAPTSHRPGRHGDLFACRECGSVQQLQLPPGERLHDLYRGMSDAAYLEEEAGRRATARRTLDAIGAHVPGGRLLDVGCGHGLLLDEARRRGYDVVGLELSASAVAYARGTLGLDVREEPFERFADAGRFDAIVLADVLEHLEAPGRALDACVELLRPGGVLCVITPDPSSITARLAGRRWWAYLPGHANLLPRRTLLELLAARGLVVSSEVPLVRTLSARYWAAGLAERLGPLGPPLARGAERFGPDSQLSLSLGDERLVLAHRVDVEPAPAPLLRDRAQPHSVWVVLPAYRAAHTISSVVDEMPTSAADHALLVDDSSPDITAEIALERGLDVLRHPVNRGYGANQKTCYVRALLDGADVVVMVHADNQYDPALIPHMVAPILEGAADVVIGSRLLDDRTLAGGMPRWKWLGNRLLTAIENRAFRARFSDYHTGYRAFSAETLRSIAFLRNSDEFVFDQEIFAQLAAHGARVGEIPIPTRYFHGASSVSFRISLRYGLRTLAVLARFRIDERRRRWTLLRRPAQRVGGEADAPR